MEAQNLSEFVNLVARMRHLQKEYFRTKLADLLVQARILEYEVDNFIEDHQQLKLF